MRRPQLEQKSLRSGYTPPARLPYLVSSNEGRSAAGKAEQSRTATLPEIRGGPSLPGYWRSIGLLAGFALAAIGAAGVLIYFAGVLVGVIVIAALSALVAWGNWILDNTIQL